MKSAGLHIILGHCERTLYNNGTDFNHRRCISFTPPQHVFQVFHNYVSCKELSQSFAVKILDDEFGDISLDEIRAGGNELVQRSIVPVAQGIIPPVKEIGI